MSGFIAGINCDFNRNPSAAGSELIFGPRAWSEKYSDVPFGCFLTRVDQKRLWGPAYDPSTRSFVSVGGRPVLTPDEWKRAENLPYEGGLAARHVLDLYRKLGVESASRLDGTYAGVIWDAEKKVLSVLTDRMGIYPVYVHRKASSIFIGSHPDVLARTCGVDQDFNLDSLAEVLSLWYATHPFTYYQGIEELDPGCVYSWTVEARESRRQYWRPAYRGDEPLRPKQLAEDLANAIRNAVAKRTEEGLGPHGVLLSAGADSRAILYSAKYPAAVKAYTFYDQPNAEYNIAGKLADQVGCSHIGLQRTPEYYVEGARDATRIMAGMWSIVDAHTLGFTPRFFQDGIETLLTGDLADLLFKGSAFNVRYKKLFSRNLPIKTLARFSYEWNYRHGKIAKKWLKPVRDRIAIMYRNCDTEDHSPESTWKIANARIFPLSRRGSVGSTTVPMRTIPWDSIFGDKEILHIYERIPPNLRVGSQVWERAVVELTPGGRTIANNNVGARVGASDLEKIAVFLFGVAHRKILNKDVDGTPLGTAVTRGSWPEFSRYLQRSRLLHELWTEESKITTEVLTDLMGHNPWTSVHVDELIRRNTNQFCRLLTIKLWLDERTGYRDRGVQSMDLVEHRSR